MKKSLRSWSALFACNLMWALQFTCIKLVQDQIGAFSTVFIPMLLTTLFMVPFVYKDVKKNKKRKWSDLKIFALLALLGHSFRRRYCLPSAPNSPPQATALSLALHYPLFLPCWPLFF
ncbi:MAG: EamA family transporter [Chitinophagaceae bacterium]